MYKESLNNSWQWQSRVQPFVQNNHQTSPFLAFFRASPGNIQNHDCHPLPHTSQASINCGQNSHKLGQCFDEGLSNGFRSKSDSRLPLRTWLPAAIFHDQLTDCSFGTSMECHEYKGDYNISSQRDRLKNRLNDLHIKWRKLKQLLTAIVNVRIPPQIQ